MTPMKITLCGSITFISQMLEAKTALEKMGHEILVPLSAERGESKDFWSAFRSSNLQEFASVKADRMRIHFNKVKTTDAILVLNYDKNDKKNYIGPNTFLEMAIAFDSSKQIFVLNEIPANCPEYEEIISMKPTVIGGNLELIK